MCDNWLISHIYFWVSPLWFSILLLACSVVSNTHMNGCVHVWRCRVYSGIAILSDVSNEEPSVMRYILKVKSIEGQ